MNKKNKILIILLLLTFLIALYLIITSEKIKNNNQLAKNKSIQSNEGIDLAILINNYKKEANLILDNYLDLLKNDSINIKNISLIKSSYLAIRVPENFKELHLKTILAFEKMENYLDKGDEEDKIISISVISETKRQIE